MSNPAMAIIQADPDEIRLSVTPAGLSMLKHLIGQVEAHDSLFTSATLASVQPGQTKLLITLSLTRTPDANPA